MAEHLAFTCHSLCRETSPKRKRSQDTPSSNAADSDYLRKEGWQHRNLPKSALVLFEKAMNAVPVPQTKKMAASAREFAHICLHRAFDEPFLADGLKTMLEGLSSDFVVSREMQTGSGRADIVVQVGQRIVLIAEVKSALATKEPLAQAMQYFCQFKEGCSKEDLCSSLVVTLRPPLIVVYGAVSVGQSSDHVLFSKLESSFISNESDDIDKLAQVFGRIKAVARELATSSASMREVQVTSDLVLKNIATHETCKRKPTVFTATCQGRQVLLKLSETGYGEEVHRFMHKLKFAPELIYCQEMKDLTVVVMELVPNAKNLAEYLKITHGQGHDYGWIKSELQKIGQTLSDEGFVHGDLRAPNFLIAQDFMEKPEAVCLVDYDWAGKGNRHYPLDLNRRLYGEGVLGGGPIILEHDKILLQQLLDSIG